MRVDSPSPSFKFDASEPIFLITYFPWDSPTGGACIVRYLIEQLHDQPFFWFTLSKPSGTMAFNAEHVERECMSPPNWGNVKLRLGRFWRWYHQSVWSRRVARHIAARIEALNPRLIWLVADFTLVPVGLRLLPSIRARRIHLSIHDHLLASAEREGFQKGFLKEVSAFQENVEKLDFSIDGVSEELISAVFPRAAETSLVTLPAISTALRHTMIAPKAEGIITIGLSGNFFGEDEFQCFVDGLDLWSQNTGRDWKMIVFGRSPAVVREAQIEPRGYLPIDEVRSELAKCDLLLLPLPVDADCMQMRTSLPTKLVTYLEVGRLIFAFAPLGSVTRRLIEESSVGIVMSQLVANDVARCMQELVSWDIEKAEAGRQHLLAGRFSEERIVRDLIRLLK